MRNFDYSKLAERTWDTDILNLVAKIHECKGRQDLFIRQKSVELDRLVEIAKIQSTEASNKIEGIVTHWKYLMLGGMRKKMTQTHLSVICLR